MSRLLPQLKRNHQPQPSRLQAASRHSASDGQITINWNKVEGATSYNVYFSNSPNVTPANGTKAGGITETSYAHTGLKNNSMYYYIVTAVKASEESLPSGEMGARPNASPPAVPTGVAASGGDGKITVRWTAVAGAQLLQYLLRNSAWECQGKEGKKYIRHQDDILSGC